MTHPLALITGSGRCGTGYIAAVLRASGVNAGHERWWTLDHAQQPGLDVDVSWLGCFDDGYPGPVFAQVRDPRSAIPSLAAAYRKHPWRLVFAQNVPLSGDPLLDAACIWVTYTTHALDRASHWWRVEDVTSDDLAHFGADTTDAIAATRRDVNTRTRQPFDWPDHPIIDQAVHLAGLLGYPQA